MEYIVNVLDIIDEMTYGGISDAARVVKLFPSIGLIIRYIAFLPFWRVLAPCALF